MMPIILVLIVIVMIAVFISSQPKTFRVERSVTVAAPAAAAFALVNDFHQWPAWSPWEKVDPNTKRTYGGSPTGVGATYAWEGNRKVGSGRMEITESRPNELVRLTIEFIVPMKAKNTIDFTFKQEGDQTVITQAMYGDCNFMAKAMHLVMSMDKMVGKPFEQGLADIKNIAEEGRVAVPPSVQQ